MSKKSTYVPTQQSSKTAYILGGVAIVVVIAVVGGLIWFFKDQGTPKSPGEPIPASQLVPNAQVAQTLKNAPADAISFTAGKADAPVKISIFEDAMCPYCGDVERTNGEEIVQAIENGKLQVTYHILDFLNGLSASKDYSTRAAGALLAIASSAMPADQKQSAWLAVHTAIFSEQPKENGSSDPSNEDLAALAKDAAADAGAPLPGDVVTAIGAGAKTEAAKAQAQAGSELMRAAGGRGTPTVIRGDGAVLNALQYPGWVTQILADA